MNRILVTGGAGFIGSHLCRKLLELGNEVHCLDNFYTGTYKNIESLIIEYPNFFIYNLDITDNQLIQFFNFGNRFDEIYNLACPASPIHYQRNPVDTIKANVLGAINVLELAKENKCKVLQASTSEIYGDPIIHPQVEGYWGNVNPIGIRSCYDEGKRCAETLFFDYNRQYNVKIKMVRIFNTYGPNMRKDDGRVVSNFIIQALKNEDITIYGYGEQTRSFCYADDLVGGLIKMMDSSNNITGPINLGNPNEFTISELAFKIKSVLNSKSEIIFEPLPEDDPKQRKPDITLAKNLLEWTPIIQLDEGLKKTIEYFKKVI